VIYIKGVFDMKNKFSTLLIFVLVIGLVLAGCSDDTNENSSSYTEDDVLVQGVLLHYYFAKEVEGIQRVVNQFGIVLNPPLANAPWVENPSLDQNVKNAMSKHGAQYSATYIPDGYGGGNIYINRHYNNTYYITGYYF
jgi:hypothetical protein